MCWGVFDCAACGRCLADIFYVLEKLSSFCAFTAVVCCIMVTVTFVLVIGIGLGYNYCVVENKVYDSGSKTNTNMPKGLRNFENPEDMNYRRTQSRVPGRTMPLPSIQPTMVLPLQDEVDLKALFSKLRAHNHNVTLQLVT